VNKGFRPESKVKVIIRGGGDFDGGVQGKTLERSCQYKFEVRVRIRIVCAGPFL